MSKVTIEIDKEKDDLKKIDEDNIPEDIKDVVKNQKEIIKFLKKHVIDGIEYL